MSAAFLDLFSRISAYGSFSLRRDGDDGNWHARVKFPTPKGVTAEVASDFIHPTAESALIQLDARIGAYLGDNSASQPDSKRLVS